MNSIRVLVIDDDEDILSAAKLFLKHNGISVDTTTEPGGISGFIADCRYDAVLLDMNFSPGARDGGEGLHWLREILKTDPLAPVIMITAFSDLDLAVQAVRAGAVHFIEKPWHNEKLLAAVRMAARLRSSSREIRRLEQLTNNLGRRLGRPYGNMIGISEGMRRIHVMIDKVAPTEANVLITGENGTGKELVARAIHQASRRSEHPFVPVDLGAIPGSLFESELFGSEAGAFTDAKKRRIGYFESAKGGTLFLDEIANLPLPSSAKLLRCLEDRRIRRIGGGEPVDIDIRLICATNGDLPTLVANGSFREDLLYRINTIEIRIPPLRERTEDIAPLVEFYLDRYREKYGCPEKSVTAGTIDRLRRYPWPGNVRELKHAVERAILLSNSDSIGPEDFVLGKASLESDLAAACDFKIDVIEARIIERVIAMQGGNVTRIAETLGISRQALYRRMEKHGLELPE